MKKILLVDDNEPDRMLYRRYLSKSEGYEQLEFREAATGAEALAEFAAYQPDCVLLDYNLPDTDGLGLLAELLALAPPNTLCVVMITGGGSELLAVRALSTGALDYLVKQQFDQGMLMKTVRHAIEKNEWRQYVTSYHDELRAVNQQLRDSLDELQNTRAEVTQKNIQLTAANAQLTAANLNLDNFVYAASHDLKQPVNNLRGLFDELRRTATFHDPEEAQVLRLVRASLDALDTTITDLAAVVQEERPSGHQPTETVLLADVVIEVTQALSREVQATQARITTDFAALPEMEGVRSNLRTILLNLVANALKYRHPSRPPLVQLRAYCEAGQAVLEVQDNGLGIDLDQHGNELFQLFRRFHPEAANGTGVGLFLVNRLVLAHGGRIAVNSKAGEGTTFRLYL
ncbi:sensor histidine kinase [Hymenobacter sp. B1770]|uniref:sensor histidine kinase n=1 Tax=Hymenobacter sp. B1770 TaxID=1718788 RepID=UPI003CED8206